MDIQTKEALIAEINNFKKEALKMHIVEVLAKTYEHSSLFDCNIDVDGSVIWYKAQARQLWDFWKAAKAQAVLELCASVEAHKIIIDEVKTEINDGYDLCQDSYLLDVLVHRGIQIGKAQAVPEWISTSERMPEEGEEVFVHSYGQVRQATRDSSWSGGFKERNCYGWQATCRQSHWMPKNIKLPEQYHFYYENDAKQKAMLEAQEQKG